MTKQNTEQQLQAHIDALGAEIKPQRDLWSGIEHAIEHNAQHQVEPKKSSRAPYAWAASLVAAVLLTWNLNSPINTPETVVELTPIEVLEQQYAQEKNSMLVSFGKPDLSKLPESMKTQFNELQSARESLLKALEDDPNNADLLNLLKWTQGQELNLLEQLYSPQWQTI